MAFDTERNSIIESESLISVLNENSELSPMSTTLFDEDNVSLPTPNVITYEKTPSRSPASQLSSPMQTMRKSVLEWEDSNHSIGLTASPAPLQSGSRSTPSPAPLQSGSRSTPSPVLAPRECTSNIKKTKKTMNKMEESFFNLTQIMQQRIMDPHNSKSTSTADNSFASLIIAELEALPEAEKRSRKQRILQILYESYNA